MESKPSYRPPVQSFQEIQKARNTVVPTWHMTQSSRNSSWVSSSSKHVPHLELFMHILLICITLFLILCHLQILLNDLNFLLHFLNLVRPNKDYVHWITLDSRIIATPPINCLKWTHIYGLLVPIVVCKL